jgi:hypothetical protein
MSGHGAAATGDVLRQDLGGNKKPPGAYATPRLIGDIASGNGIQEVASIRLVATGRALQSAGAAASSPFSVAHCDESTSSFALPPLCPP